MLGPRPHRPYPGKLGTFVQAGKPFLLGWRPLFLAKALRWSEECPRAPPTGSALAKLAFLLLPAVHLSSWWPHPTP